MKNMSARLTIVCLVLLAALTGCSSPASDSSENPSASSPSASSSSVSGSSSSASPEEAITSVRTVDPNTATRDELTAALESAGVDHPDKWAREVGEYGPYTAENLKPTLTQELGKYDISQEQLSRVLSALKVG